MKKHWPNKTLDELEGVKTKIIRNDSYLLMTCSRLRAKKPLNEFEIEDLRILIGQSIGLKFLIPLAIEELEKNILAEGHYYEGDLFHSVTFSDANYWKENKEQWNQVCTIFDKNLELLESFGRIAKVKSDWFPHYNDFLKIHS